MRTKNLCGKIGVKSVFITQYSYTKKWSVYMAELVNSLDQDIQNEQIKTALKSSIKGLFPLEINGKKLVIDSIHIPDELADDDFPVQKETKLSRKSWQMPIMANFTLQDSNGRVLDRAKDLKIGNIPKITNRFTAIIDGNEYQTVNQIRRKSGIYSHVQKNGELIAEFNLSRGQNFKMQLDPISQLFVLIYANRKYRLWTLLNALGIGDTEIKKYWGEELLEINKKGALNTEASELTSIYKILYKKEPKDFNEVITGVRNYFGNGSESTEVDPDTTKITLGESIDAVNSNALLLTSKKLLGINKGEDVADDRDSLIFKKIYSVDDLLINYFDKQAKIIQSKLKRTLDRKDRVKDILSAASFGEPIKRFFTVGDLSSTPAQTNPVTIAAEWRKTTPMGTGGIQSRHAITMETRDLQPTHLGFLDSLASPECLTSDTQILTLTGWVNADEITPEHKLACNINGKLEFNYPEKIHEYNYTGILYGVKNSKIEYLVTEEHKIFTVSHYSQQNGFKLIPAKEITGKCIRIKTNTNPYDGLDIKYFELPNTSVKIDINDWAEFIGWYLSEGNVYTSANGYTNVVITQLKEVNPNKWNHLSNLLAKLPFVFNEFSHCFSDNLIVELHSYLKTLGQGSYNKSISDYYFTLPLSARKRLMYGLLAGDGRRIDPRSNKAKDFEFEQDTFTTNSPQLAEDVERLAISLGYTVSHNIYEYTGDKAKFHPAHEVRLMHETEAVVRVDQHYTQEYDGKVHCVTVPGSLIMIKYGNGRPHWTGNSSKIGVSVGLASEVQKVGNEMKTPVIDKSGKIKFLSPTEFFGYKIGFPDQYEQSAKGGLVARFPFVTVMYKGKTEKLPQAEVEYYLRSPKTMFSLQQNLVPFMANTQGNRASTGARMITQAVALNDKEAPLVVNQRDSASTYENAMSQYLVPVAPFDATVTNITPDYITLKDWKGSLKKIGLYNNFPLNQDGYLHSQLNVGVGDKVKKGQPMFDHTYSDNGTLALGKNLTVAFMSYKGYNFEDGAVITDSAAKKLAHTNIHRINVFFSPKNATFDKAKFSAWYPDILPPDNAKKLDDDGLIRVGETVHPGDVVCAFLVEKELDDMDMALKKLDKVRFHNFSKNVSIWDEEETGVVTDVAKVGRNIDIYIKSSHPLKEGDKIAGRYGNKGIITKIIPDSDAPHRPDGTAIEVLLSPEGVPGRMNIGQILETAAAKIAEKTGKPYVVNNFMMNTEDQAKTIYDEMEKLHIPVNEVLTDGRTGKKIEKPIFVGKQYIMKLRHTVKKKQGVHSYGVYDVDEQPAGKGAQKIGTMETYAYLAHGALNNLREMGEIKGRKNEQYWRDLQFGIPPGKPERNFVFEKMLVFMKGMGINTEKKGSNIKIFPLTDKDTLALSNGEPQDPGAMLVGKNLTTRKEGLFDPIKTGGARGTQWTHLTLPERIPSPLYEDAIIKMLNLTEASYDNIIAGKVKLGEKTGTTAIVDALKKVNVAKTLKELEAELKTAPPTNVNKLNTKIKYLKALKELEYSPVDAYTMKYVPVIPPLYRPAYPLPSGDTMVQDVNHLYRNVGIINNGIKANLKDGNLTDDKKVQALSVIYNAVGALQGIVDPIDIQQQKYKGFMKQLEKTKTGYIQGTVWSKRQDISGRSTITVDPELDLDEVGLPKGLAYKMFKPFIIKDMKEAGLRATDALKNYEDETPMAKNSMQSVLGNRLVLLNRAPTLHQHGIQAFKPILSDGKSIKLNPLVIGGFNADFDGDTMSVMTPIGKEAQEEAKEMLPSKILFKHGDNALVPQISKDYVYGLYELSKINKVSDKKFSSIAEAKAAKLDWNTQFDLNGKKVTIGQYMINSELPKEFRDYEREMSSKNVKKVLAELAHGKPTFFADVINSWKNLGAMTAYQKGHTVSLTDFLIDKKYRNDILKTELPRIEALPEDQRVAEYGKMLKNVEIGQNIGLKNAKSNFHNMQSSGTLSGSKGFSITQIVSMPGIVTDVQGRPIPLPITKSYGEGLDTASYWNTLYGVRKGIVDRSVNTAESGALNKALLNVTRRLLVTIEDCHTVDGIDIEINDKNVMDRALLVTIPGIARRNEVIDSQVINKLRAKGISKVKVRSPLTCEAPDGVCKLCYGLMPDGEFPNIGENVGILDSHAVTERATQLTMQCTSDSFTIDSDGNFTILSKCFTQSHAPHAKMVALYMEDGGCMLVQDNHPMWINDYEEKLVRDIVPTVDTVKNMSKVIADKYSQEIIKDDTLAVLPPYMMGCFAGDGCFRYYDERPEVPRAIIITNIRMDIKEKLNSLHAGTIREEDFQIFNTELAIKLKEQIRPYAKQKALLLDWKKLSKKWLGSFISGLIDTDGCIDRTGLKIYSTSFTLLDQVRTMAAILGIPGTLRLEKRRSHQMTQQYSLKLRDSAGIKLYLQESFKVKIDWLPGKLRMKQLFDKEDCIVKRIVVIPIQSDIEIVYDRKTIDKKFISGTYLNHNTFHSGGVAAAGGGITAGFPRLEQLVQVPEKLPGKAVLAETGGIITNILKNAAGGYTVHMDEKQYVVQAGLTPIVSVGQVVKKGDALSDGIIKPQELGELKTYLDAQRYIVDEIDKVYKDAGFYKKTYETLVRGISDNAIVTDAPKGSGFDRGDKTSISFVKYMNKQRSKEGLDEIKYDPYFKSIETLNTDSDDWMTKVTTNRIKAALRVGAAKGQYANIKGKDPVPAYLYGENFGKNTDYEKGEFF